MNQDIFVNEAINEGITNFVEGKNPEDFTTIIISTLVNIYGQLDIVNPYKTKSEKSFDSNITKFGYTKEDLSLFKQNVLNFYLSKDEKPNKYFNKVEKQLIDMFFIKMNKMQLSESDINTFNSYIQYEGTKLNDIYSANKKEIKKYYNYKNKFRSFNINYKLEEQNKLNKEAYETLGYSYDNIVNMSDQELVLINQKVFDYYNIDASSADKYQRLNQAVAYFKQFPKKKVEPKKAANGYTAFILIISFVIITLLSIAIVLGVLSK